MLIVEALKNVRLIRQFDRSRNDVTQLMGHQSNAIFGPSYGLPTGQYSSLAQAEIINKVRLNVAHARQLSKQRFAIFTVIGKKVGEESNHIWPADLELLNFRELAQVQPSRSKMALQIFPLHQKIRW